MLVMGVVGFLLERHGFPVAPIVLGLVLGPMVESNFMTSMIISQWDLSAFFARPISAFLGVLTIGVWLLPLLKFLKEKVRALKASSKTIGSK